MTDSPISWFILMCIGLYFIARFLLNIMHEMEAQKIEREKACQEIFLENSIDKRNVMMYNKSVNKEGNQHEFYDDRYGNQ